MLKRLELWGFKSFADKTVFEFDRGITAIVGPNGSGKSNVVDAIRWVLGEQSAKSLRGKEMADCIFHGSGTRKGLGFAEVTVVIDNRRRYLRFDGDEVSITRRVYRSGESEYSINRKPARLRDIKELLVGTGTSSQTYSIIEQGRVDALLQASARERRLIFEEASGIRGFKLKKQEALSKLEKVEQNLTRLNDILDEVHRRLKTVRAQASKAQRYRELSSQLRERRIEIGLVDYHRLRDQLAALADELAAADEELQRLEARLEAATSREMELDAQLDELDRTIRSEEGELSDTRQQIARLESTIEHERARCAELEAALQQSRHRWRDASQKCRVLQKRVAELEQRFEQERQRVTDEQERLAAEEATARELSQQLDQLDHRIDAQRAELADCTHELTRCRNEVTALDSQRRTLDAQRERYRLRAEQLQRQLDELSDEVRSLRDQLNEASTELAEHRTQLEQLESTLRDANERLGQLRTERGELVAALRGCESKLEVYRKLEQEQPGIPTALRTVITQGGFDDEVLGVLGELIEADVDVAPLVDRVLGPMAHALVVRSADRLITLLQDAGLDQTVRLLDADAGPVNPQPPVSDAIPLNHLVRCADEIRPAVDRLLGSTFVVDRFDPGQPLSLAPGQRLITRDGLLIGWDGSIVLGALDAETGIVSRRAAMRQLEAEHARLQTELAEQERKIAEVQQQIEATATLRDDAQTRCRTIEERVSELERTAAQRGQQHESVREELDLLRDEMALLEQELGRLSAAIQEKQARQAELEQTERQLRETIDQLQSQRATLAEQRQACTARMQEVKVALAEQRERMKALERELQAARQDLAERLRIKEEAISEMGRIEQQWAAARRSVLIATAQVADLYAVKDRLVRDVGRLVSERAELRARRQEMAAESERIRREYDELRQRLTEYQLRRQDLEHRLKTLVERVLEDYDTDLHELARQRQPDPDFDYDRAKDEARKLKKKLQALGSVNLDALRELEELEARERTLEEQRGDLLSAKNSLLEIIDRINEDSKRLFLDTLNRVREHFQELFRKLFGGGKADIVLEDPNDVLESGVEIIAKPPGKELRSISLLSGGEKTLTAVALLLAIFRSKPSPFCILDEVDAALDEANIDRFTAVLREFLDRSQFILITHSKKTMLAADVLYGVTMQESGVSKRISVRLEDINEAGEIRPEALKVGDQEAAA